MGVAAVVIAALLGLVVGVGSTVVARVLALGYGRNAQRHGRPGVVLVAFGTAALFGATAARFGPHVVLPAYLYLGAVAVVLSLIDIDVHRLPNVIVLPSYPIAAGLLGGAALVDHDGGTRAVRAVVGMALYYSLFLVLRLIYPGGMGFGDVKLAGLLGLYLGWLGYGVLIAGSLLGTVAGGLVALGLVAAGRAGRKTALPYGPFMLFGALVAVLGSGAVVGGG